MNAREERGLVIAATQKLTQKGKVWVVPSQSGRGKYTVCPDPKAPSALAPTTRRPAASASTFTRSSAWSPASRALAGSSRRPGR
jgi:hypothetical protein